ncbi:MAG TPA: D-alanyl-D-alanine carboxypeptidase, partial [Actinopolymorphaceae bacterium]
SIDQLFHGMLVKSANDAANALARANGGIDETVAEMNAVAERIGARDTHADNPSGLDPDDDSPQYTSAHDLALIARMGMRHPDFRRYICTKSYAFPAGNGGTYVIDNTNRLLGKYPGMFGVKTGYTSKAGNTIVVAAEQHGARVLVSALRINEPTYPTIATLLDWGIGAVGKVEPVGRMTLPLDPVRAARARFRAYALS